MRERHVLACLVVFAIALDGAVATAQFRTIDGKGNNVTNPLWGSAGLDLRRIVRTDYGDGRSTPAGAQRPSARVISNMVVAQTGSVPNGMKASLFIMQWGQFLDHDIDLTPTASPVETFDIPVPLGDPHFDPFRTGTMMISFSRSAYVQRRARQQVNAITAWIDASQVYGSDVVRQAALRASGGRLLTSSTGNLLPYNTVGLPNAPSNAPIWFLAGDVRANEQVALTAMHTLFMREHNRLEGLLRLFLPTQPQLRYDVARMIVGAEMQAITYREFLPVILGPQGIAPYRGYKPQVDGSIANVFSTAAYRFGHSTLPTSLWRLDASRQPIPAGHLPLRSAFFAPQEIVQHGIEPLLRGLAEQRAQDVDCFVVDGLRNMLFGAPGADGGLDLAALNMQRGRDHGLPSYNNARLDVGLSLMQTFSQVSSNASVVAKLRAAYASVNDIDVWMGGLAEDHVPGAIVGPLVHRVLKRQFERLRDGDRFFYRHVLPKILVDYVHHMTLARIIRANTTIGSEIRNDVFHVR